MAENEGEIKDGAEATADETSAATSDSQPGVRRSTKILIGITIVVVAIRLGARFLASEIEDVMGSGLDFINFVSMFAIMFLFFCWVVWFLFASRLPTAKRLGIAALLVALPVGFFKILRPVNGGDVDFLRFEPIWASRPAAPPADEATVSAGADLTPESPQDFARFWGPNQDGKVNFSIDPAAFPAQCEIKWKKPIGLGWSGFVARNGFAVTMEQRGESECVTCYEIATGDLVWNYLHAARHRDSMNLGRTGPRATPTIHAGKVFSVGAVGNFACLDGATGEEIWSVDLNELLGIELGTDTDDDGLTVHFEANTSLAWGRSNSPLVVGDKVIVPGGGPLNGKKATLLAFEIESGELAWRGGEEMIAYGSPTLATVAGRRQILMTAESKAMGFDPETGAVLWEFDRPGNSGSMANTSQLTVVSESKVLTSKGYPDGGGELIELSDSDGKLTAESAWFNGRVLKTKLTSPVIVDGYAYSISNGFFECTDLSDGTRVWKHRGRFGHGQILQINDHILLHSESGVLHLVAPSSEEYQELGTFETIDGICWNTLCVYGSSLLVRSEIEAACISLPTKK